MITNEALERVRGWFVGRLPEEWRSTPPEITVDREEITVVLTVADVDLPDGSSDAERDEARAGRTKAFREDTRPPHRDRPRGRAPLRAEGVVGRARRRPHRACSRTSPPRR